MITGRPQTPKSAPAAQAPPASSRPGKISSTIDEGPLNFWTFGLLLLVLLLATFPQVVAGFETFAYLDFGQFALPNAFYQRQSFWHGELPFWNPLNSSGVPFLAQWNTLALYPVSIFYLLLPFPWSICIFLLLHLLWGGLGMYRLVEHWTEQKWAAALAGAVFAFNGFTWYALIWPHITAGMAWLPWVVLAMERAADGGTRRLLTAGVVAAMQLLTGGAEVILLTWLVVSAGFVLRGCRVGAPRLALIGRLFASGGLALALAAVQLLPFVDLLLHSQRSTHYSDPNMAVMPLTGLANYLVPVFHCTRNPQGLFVPPNHWTGSYYLGIGVVLLALFSIWKARRALTWVLLGLTVFSIGMAMGEKGPLYGWLSHLVPGIGFLRFPSKFVMLATFTVPVLAGFGLAKCRGLAGQKRESGTRPLTILIIGIALVIGLLIVWARQHPAVPGEELYVTSNGLGRLIFLAAFGICLIAMCRVPALKNLAPLGLVLLLWLDVGTHNADLSPTVRPGALEPDAVRKYLHWDEAPKLGSNRVMESRGAYRTMLAIGFRNLEDDTAGRRLAQFFDYNLLDGVPKVDGFYSLELKEYARIFNWLYYGNTNAEPAGLMDFLGVSQISSRTNATEWLSRNTGLPLVTAGEQPLFVNDEAAFAGILSSEFDPRRVVYLPRRAEEDFKTIRPARATISHTEWSAQRINFDVEAESAAVVVVAQSFYHAWEARVDGQPERIWKANYGFQGLRVPAGKHHVMLVYRDRAFWWGAWLSGGALLVCAGAWIYCGRRGERSI